MGGEKVRQGQWSGSRNGGVSGKVVRQQGPLRQILLGRGERVWTEVLLVTTDYDSHLGLGYYVYQPVR